MMLDANVVAASPSSVYRVLRLAGAIKPHSRVLSEKRLGSRSGPRSRTNGDGSDGGLSGGDVAAARRPDPPGETDRPVQAVR